MRESESEREREREREREERGEMETKTTKADRVSNELPLSSSPISVHKGLKLSITFYSNS